MVFWIGRIYDAITGVAAPPVTMVRRAIGAAAPCEATLRRWRKGHTFPGAADIFFLLAFAEKRTPGFRGENEEKIRDAWWAAARENAGGRSEVLRE